MKNPLQEKTPDGIWLAPGFGKKGDELIIETSEAKVVLERYITEYEASMTPLSVGHENGGSSGVVGIVAERSASVRGVSPDASARRLWAIRYEESTNVSLDWYEAFLIAMDTTLSQVEDIPIFPAGRQAAIDMVEVRAEELSEIEQRQLAKSLWNFTRGYMSMLIHEKKLEREQEAAA